MDINKLILEYDELHTKMFNIYELKKKYTTVVLLNIDSKKKTFLTFDKQPDETFEINLKIRHNAEPICGVMEKEINEPLEHFEKNLKEFQENFLKRKLEEEKDITSKGFTEIDYVKIGFTSYPRIKIIKSTSIIDLLSSKMIKCSWEKPIVQSTADKLLKLKKKDLILSHNGSDFICRNITKIELTINKTHTGTDVCFGMSIQFKKGEKVK